MWIKRRVLLISLFLVGCTPYLPVEVKHYMVGVNTALVDQTSVVSYSDSLVFESQFGFLDLEGHYDIGGIQPQDFTFTSPGKYSILGFADSIITGNSHTDVVILEDESGSYDTLDPLNFRSKMINRVCQDIGPPGDFMLGGYSMHGGISEPVEFSTTGFSNDWNSQQDFLFNLALRTGGQSSLYDALTTTLDRFAASSTTVRNIIVLAHTGDQGSTSSVADVVAKANLQQVKISVMFFGNEREGAGLSGLSGLTGGMLAILPTNLEMVTAFNHLYRLLAGERHVYKVKVSFKPESGIFTKSEMTHTINVTDYTTGKSYNPLLIYTKLP